MLLATLLVILWLQLAWVSTQQLNQSPQSISIQEGEDFITNCSSSTNLPILQWYRQDPGKGLTFLMALSKGKELKRQGKITAQLDEKRQHSFLFITGTQPGDSARYFCGMAYRGGEIKLTFGTGTELRVKPNIKDPQPALYQLTSPKSSDTSVCLLTDFDSSNTYTNGNDSTVLEMMTMESKSYGAVAWGSKSSFNCTNAFPQNIINLTQPSGSTCKVQDVEQSFETDKDLNLMNASLIFLRVIFLKTVGFNLLMTLRLWSN